MSHRSARYAELAAEVDRQFSPDQPDKHLASWWQQHGRRWVRRVGKPRLTAEAALFDSLGLLRSINRGVFRSRPEEAAAYDRALAALDEITMLVGRENWRRFQGEPRA